MIILEKDTNICLVYFQWTIKTSAVFIWFNISCFRQGSWTHGASFFHNLLYDDYFTASACNYNDNFFWLDKAIKHSDHTMFCHHLCIHIYLAGWQRQWCLLTMMTIALTSMIFDKNQSHLSLASWQWLSLIRNKIIITSHDRKPFLGWITMKWQCW